MIGERLLVSKIKCFAHRAVLDVSALSGCRLLVQAMAVSRVAQYLHRVASTGRSDALHSGQVLVGSGSPNTVVPRRRM